MKKEEKTDIAAAVGKDIKQYKSFYIADLSNLTVIQSNALRRLCHKKGVKLQVVKNTLIRKAIESANLDSTAFKKALKGSSSILFSENSKAPAQLIKEFREKNDKPLLKAAYIEESLYLGDENLDLVLTLKSKNELIGDVIGILQSPMKNVVSALKSSSNKIAGLVKTLEERNRE